MRIRRLHHSPIEVKFGDDNKCVVKEHSHNELSIGFISRGKTCVTIDKIDFPLAEKDIILIPDGRVHLCLPEDRENFNFTMLYIDPLWIRDVFNIETKTILSESCTGDDNIFSHLNDFIEIEDPTESECILFIGELFTKYFDIVPFIKEPVKEVLENIKKYLTDNFEKQIFLDDISEMFGINKFSLIRNFKKQYELSPHSYIINLRINRSKELLKTGKSFTEIAIECGFYDQSHFIKTFNDYTGMTPENFK